MQEIDGISEEFVGRLAARARESEELRRPALDCTTPRPTAGPWCPRCRCWPPRRPWDKPIVHESRAVIALLCEASGVGVHFLDSPLQRYKRDVETAMV